MVLFSVCYIVRVWCILVLPVLLFCLSWGLWNIELENDCQEVCHVLDMVQFLFNFPSVAIKHCDVYVTFPLKLVSMIWIQLFFCQTVAASGFYLVDSSAIVLVPQWFVSNKLLQKPKLKSQNVAAPNLSTPQKSSLFAGPTVEVCSQVPLLRLAVTTVATFKHFKHGWNS